MRLTAEEEAILAGRRGEPARRALQMQVATGEFFGAQRMVPVTSAHLTGDPESMGARDGAPTAECVEAAVTGRIAQ
jgi:hypothetical protein